jgi:hypothetical protein
MENLCYRFNNPLLYDYETKPRGKYIREIINYSFCLTNPYSNLVGNEVRSTPLKYVANELILYFALSNSAKDYVKASKFWDYIRSGDFIESAYGYLLFGENCPINWVFKSLINDKDSRQAIVHYNLPKHLKEVIPLQLGGLI